jgi:hypothetical protein
MIVKPTEQIKQHQAHTVSVQDLLIREKRQQTSSKKANSMGRFPASPVKETLMKRLPISCDKENAALGLKSPIE